MAIVRSFVTGNGNHDIKPVMSPDTLNAISVRSIQRVAGPLRASTAMPTNVALFPRAVDEAEAGPAINSFGNFESTVRSAAPLRRLSPEPRRLVCGGRVTTGFETEPGHRRV